MEETRTNEQLVLACQAGDKQAIAQLWEQTKALICSWCYHYYERGRDRCAACGVELADLQQEGFLALLDAVQAFRPEQEYKFTSYLNFPLKNRCNALLGKRGAPRLLNGCGSLDETIGEDGDTSQLDMIADPNAGEGFESVEDREYNRQLSKQAIYRMRKGQAMKILNRFLDESSRVYTGTGFQAWKNGGSVQERMAERVERYSMK